jgi:hypothetical protein
MKKMFGFLLVASSLLLSSAAHAQQFRAKADIPFDFVIANHAYKAGSYDIQKLAPGSQLLTVYSEDGGGKETIVSSQPCAEQSWAKSTKLVFRRVGSTYFLYQVWVEGRQFGSQFRTPKMQTELAQNGTKSEDVIVAAVLVK